MKHCTKGFAVEDWMDFPDSRIGASLKQDQQSEKLDAARHDFPDSRIGASLKPGRPCDVRGRRLHFPDSRIGASLKLAMVAAFAVSASATSPIRESGPH